MLADRGYDSDNFRQDLLAHEILTVFHPAKAATLTEDRLAAL